jgi:hypothetical protein
MEKYSNSDGCADVFCGRHGLLGRAISGASAIFCKGCGRWLRADSAELSERRSRNRDRKRAQRAEIRSAKQELNPVTL